MGRPKDEKGQAEKIASDREKLSHHLDAYEQGKAFVDDAKAALHNVIESARQDGFTTEDLKFGLSLKKQKEREARATIRRRLYIAKLVGSSLGEQMDLFVEPEKPAKAPMATAKVHVSFDGPATVNSPPGSGFTPFTAEELEEQQRLAEEASKH